MPSTLKQLIRSFLVAAALLLLAVPVSEARLKTYIVPSEAMEPAFSVGERITVDLNAYDVAEPELGDPVVFHPPRGGDSRRPCGVKNGRKRSCLVPHGRLTPELFLKRIVAVPGDRLSFRSGRPVVDGAMVLTDVIQACHYPELCYLPRAITILPDHYFMEGDNSGASDDSRFWGPVPRRAIIGKVVG